MIRKKYLDVENSYVNLGWANMAIKINVKYRNTDSTVVKKEPVFIPIVLSFLPLLLTETPPKIVC